MSAPATYLDPTTLPFPFCPGCGHGTILEQLDAAMARLGWDPKSVVIVSDIGCSGLSDAFFATNAFHGLHGRSVTYATGVKLANPDLNVVVLMGDGGCGIGGHHLINAARRNVGVTVVVFNNLNYGMTGGSHSVSTPPGGLTATTPLGQLERPMDICGTVTVNGAGFVARTTTFHDDVSDLLERALAHDGFALVDVWELCTAYYASANRLNRASMEGLLGELGFAAGLLRDEARPEMARAYRDQHAGLRGSEAMEPRPVPTTQAATLKTPLRWIFAGAAGKRIGSAAGALATGAVASGLEATQRADYPVTVRTGFSMAEVILSPEPILFTGIETPDVVLDLFAEGHAKVAARIAALPPATRVYSAAELVSGRTEATVVPLDFAAAKGYERKKDRWASMATAVALRDTAAYPMEAYLEALGAEARAAAEAALALW